MDSLTLSGDIAAVHDLSTDNDDLVGRRADAVQAPVLTQLVQVLVLFSQLLCSLAQHVRDLLHRGSRHPLISIGRRLGDERRAGVRRLVNHLPHSELLPGDLLFRGQPKFVRPPVGARRACSSCRSA
ncbi:hypothetical protein ACFC0D_19100 [Streptomyces sp. NPDC056222]|uniref:hypothetical protein n=1 Tax=Streptomyces sp. NPDC056222 TaxID=3345749 RepID=UPI0035D8A464